jgi:hypothetical protein
MRAFPAMLVSLAVSIISLSCTADNTTGPVNNGPQQVAAVVVSPDAVSAETGDQITVSATPTDSLGHPVDTATVTWRSSDPMVATVTGAGDIAAVSPGTTSITASSGGKSAPVAVTVFAVGVGEKARAADVFVNSIGANTHLSYFDKVYGSGFTTIIKPKVAKLGIRQLRDGGQVWPDAAWMNNVYGRYRELSTFTGAKFTVIMNPVGTSSGAGQNYASATHLYTLLDYIGRDNVAAFEGLNEHDLSGRATWVADARAMQQALFSTIKKDAQLATRYHVLGPTVTSFGAATAIGDLTAYMDYGSMHPYPGGKLPSSSIVPNIEGLRSINGQRVLQATETGYHNAVASTDGHRGVSEAAMGKYVPRLFLEYFNAGVARTFEYELIDQGSSTTSIQERFGLLRVDGTEKPAYVALANLIGLLSDPGAAFLTRRLDYSLTGDVTNLHHTLLQKRDGRFYLTLWLEVPSYDLVNKVDITVAPRPITVTLGTSISRARIFVPLVAATPQSDISMPQQVALSVGDHPVVLELTP